jgi:hypothetical protein
LLTPEMPCSSSAGSSTMAIRWVCFQRKQKMNPVISSHKGQTACSALRSGGSESVNETSARLNSKEAISESSVCLKRG